MLVLDKSELGCRLVLFIGVANVDKDVDELVDFSIAKNELGSLSTLLLFDVLDPSNISEASSNKSSSSTSIHLNSGSGKSSATSSFPSASYEKPSEISFSIANGFNAFSIMLGTNIPLHLLVLFFGPITYS